MRSNNLERHQSAKHADRTQKRKEFKELNLKAGMDEETFYKVFITTEIADLIKSGKIPNTKLVEIPEPLRTQFRERKITKEDIANGYVLDIVCVDNLNPDGSTKSFSIKHII